MSIATAFPVASSLIQHERERIIRVTFASLSMIYLKLYSEDCTIIRFDFRPTAANSTDFCLYQYHLQSSGNSLVSRDLAVPTKSYESYHLRLLFYLLPSTRILYTTFTTHAVYETFGTKGGW